MHAPMVGCCHSQRRVDVARGRAVALRRFVMFVCGHGVVRSQIRLLDVLDARCAVCFAVRLGRPGAVAGAIAPSGHRAERNLPLYPTPAAAWTEIIARLPRRRQSGAV